MCYLSEIEDLVQMIMNHSDALTVFSCLLFLRKQVFKGHQTSIFKEAFLDLKASNGGSGLTQESSRVNVTNKITREKYLKSSVMLYRKQEKNKLRGDVKDVKTSNKNRKTLRSCSSRRSFKLYSPEDVKKAKTCVYVLLQQLDIQSDDHQKSLHTLSTSGRHVKPSLSGHPATFCSR